MTDGDCEAQRGSIAYGNTHIDNERITRETVAAAMRWTLPMLHGESER